MKKNRARSLSTLKKAVNIQWRYENGYAVLQVDYKTSSKVFGPYANYKRAVQDYRYLVRNVMKQGGKYGTR